MAPTHPIREAPSASLSRQPEGPARRGHEQERAPQRLLSCGGVLDRDGITRRYARVRARTEALVAPLSAEDAMVQSMPDASPAKWHLAHTTWFFEEFVLARFDRAHRWHDERWRVLYNSYYEAVGPRHARSARGILSRPSLEEVHAWRRAVDQRVLALLERGDETVLATTLLGTHHEEQHQELILTDIKHALYGNPLFPAYRKHLPAASDDTTSSPPIWVAFHEAVGSIGSEGESFAFDNEIPRHRVLVGPFAMASCLVTNAEYAEFIDDGGYDRAALWLSDGWDAVRSGEWRAPLYWEGREGDAGGRAFGFDGVRALDARAPVSHVSFYEADAYARWAGARLPTEQEWESVAGSHPVAGNFVESALLAPAVARGGTAVTQLFGDAWEWTASAYRPYPRFRPLQGALGEYNGKFMSGQMVLRGGSCLSPADHLRASYRNFFPPGARWQMTGIRLARDG
jgi:ergothioneine biosynthesis protein EgtB